MPLDFVRKGTGRGEVKDDYTVIMMKSRYCKIKEDKCVCVHAMNQDEKTTQGRRK